MEGRFLWNEALSESANVSAWKKMADLEEISDLQKKKEKHLIKLISI